MRGLARARWLAGAAVLALAVTACGGGGDDDDTTGDDTGSTGDAAVQGGTLRIYASEPAFLLPGQTNETAGSAVLNALYSPLIDYDIDTGDPYPVVASALPESEDGDNIHWTITINEGWTFHDGQALTAQSFVDAWNWTAYGPNAAANGYFFGPGMASVVGYDELQTEDPDGEEGPETAPPPAAETMTGLEVVDDTTFTVELTEPFSQFPLMLGYTAFFPMAEACIADTEACNEAPIGNGPFKIDGTWNHNESINVVKYDDWAGESPPNIDGVNFQIYSDPNTGYLDLQDQNIDYMAALPSEELAAAKEAYGDRFIEQPSSTFQYIGFPLWDANWGGTPEDNYGGDAKAALRHAMSMAINRQELIDTVFNGAYQPADSLVSPVVQGYREGACGEFCTYDVDAAKALYEESGGLTEPIQIWFNDGAGHDQWLQAVGNYWQAAFGVEYQLQARVWADYLQAQGDHALDGPFRLGWVMDYPSAQNYIAPIYGPGAGEPNFGYSNPDADALMTEGNKAATVEEGLDFYNQAEDLVLADFPNIPMWFGQTLAAYNENVDNVIVDKFGNIDLLSVTVTDAS
jgi:ABC-type oligopeptide transport system substrate-binding subunit